MTDPNTAAGRTALVADARNRALRTFLQGLGIDVLVAVALVVYAATAGDGDVQWALLPAMLTKTVLHSAASYVMRRFLDRSGVPTPTPPSDLT